MSRYIFLLIILSLFSGCVSHKTLDKSALYGIWEAVEENEYVATYEFRENGVGSYKYFNHEKVCTMSYEFSWSIKSGRILVVGYHGMEIDDEYIEVMLHSEITAKYKQGILTRLKPKNASYYLSKKA